MCLTGTKIESDGYLGYYDSQVTVIPEGDYFEFFGWIKPGLNKFSFYRKHLLQHFFPAKAINWTLTFMGEKVLLF